MTNLSDLFPAGAGKQVSFTASGNVTGAGKPVVLNSDGTVSQVSGLTATAPVETVLVDASLYAYYRGTGPIIYDSVSQKVIWFYIPGANQPGYARVGEVSGSSVNWGTAVQFSGGNVEAYGAQLSAGVAYDVASQRVLIAYTDGYYPSARTGKLVVGTVSGTSISFGTPVSLHGAVTSNYSVTYDSNAQKCAVFFTKDSDSTIRGVVATVSGTSVTIGSEYTVQTMTGAIIDLRSTFDSSNNKVVLAYRNYNTTNYLRNAVITISGTSMSAGTLVDVTSFRVDYWDVSYDQAAQKVVTAYTNNPTSKLEVKVGTVSGTSISYGSAAVTTQNNPRDPSLAYDSRIQQVVLATAQSPANAYSISISGTTPTVSPPTRLSSGNSAYYVASTYDTNAQKSVAVYTFSSGYFGSYNVFSLGETNLTSTNFLGISDAAISSAASGNITIKGGIAATGLSSLTPASDYYVQPTGAFGTSAGNPSVKAGKALSATSINLEYTS